MAKVLVVAAHPDDEILGCGGTLLRRRRGGDELFALILGSGVSARGQSVEEADQAAILSLRRQSEAAGQIIGFQKIFFEDLADNRFDRYELLDIVKKVEGVFAEVRPDIVYTHHAHDLNIDHRLTCEAVLTAGRPSCGTPVKKIFSFETISSTEWQINDHRQFSPNTYIDIAAFLAQKLEALKCFTGEVREYPHPRSTEGLTILAQSRGLEAGFTAAEAFNLVRDYH